MREKIIVAPTDKKIPVGNEQTRGIMLTSRDLAYLSGITHSEKGEDDYCIGVFGADGGLLVYSDQVTTDNYCLMPDNSKAAKLGFARRDLVRDFIARKYIEGIKDQVADFFSPIEKEEKNDAAAEEGADNEKEKFRLRMRSENAADMGDAEDGDVSGFGIGMAGGKGIGPGDGGSNDRGKSSPHQGGLNGNRYLRDPNFYIRSVNYIRRGKVPHEEDEAKRKRHIVYPDGQIRFWKKPVSTVIADAAWDSIVGLAIAPAAVLWNDKYRYYCMISNERLAARGKGPDLACEFFHLVSEWGVKKGTDFFYGIYKPVLEMSDGEKTDLIKTTFEDRSEQYDAFSEIAKREALINVEKDLEEIWSNPRLTLAEKKRRLFEYWDDCIEGDGSASQRDVAGAMYIREKTKEFIRANFPVGSGLEYTSEELRQINVRRDKLSRMVFAPYSPSDKPSDHWLSVFLNA